jgi:tricorn protease
MRILLVIILLLPALLYSQNILGYYRYPALHENMIIFTAEGDLWKVATVGGMAQRLTTHQGMESHAAFSPDGKWIAFSGEYEGPIEVYTMSVDGSLPQRRTYEGETANVVGWTMDEKILYTSQKYSTLPNLQLLEFNTETNSSSVIPLNQASEGVYNKDKNTLFFTRLPFQGSHTKRYRGGTAQNIWKFESGKTESSPLTTDYTGTSKNPMFWQGRVYFVSDRDGTMNLWSMTDDGKDLIQHTYHKGYDISDPDLNKGRIVYQCIADLYLYDIVKEIDKKLDIKLASDFEHRRNRWVKKPMDYLTDVHVSPDGDRIVLTSRGKVFVAPRNEGRLIEVTPQEEGVRYRNACFMPDGKTLVMLSDKSGELEYWTKPANGLGTGNALTSNGDIFRYTGIPSPDGKWLAFTDKNYVLWLHEIDNGKTLEISSSEYNNFSHLTWSPDSKWLAFVATADNFYSQLNLYNIESKKTTALTSDRVDSYNPAWTPDGKYLYFLSDRYFNSVVSNPWGPYQPEPFFDRTTKIYVLPLQGSDKSPFLPDNEILIGNKPDNKSKESKEEKDKEIVVNIDLANIGKRISEVPVEAGMFYGLTANDKQLFFMDREMSLNGKRHLKVLEIKNNDVEMKTLLNEIDDYELSYDGKKIMAQKQQQIYIVDAVTAAPTELDKSKIDLSQWTFTVDPQEEWRQMFVEAWRLERDYFYDPQMHGVDYKELLNRYLPYVNRVMDRDELSDLISHLVGELSALHIFVGGGDIRKGDDDIKQGFLGAKLIRNEREGGYQIEHIYQADPNYPDTWSPLAKPEVNAQQGDIITAIDGVSLLNVSNPGEILKNKVGKQILVDIKSSQNKKSRVIVKPISASTERNLRYDEWEFERRREVEMSGKGDIGYIHLRAMGGDNYSEWVRNYFPVFNRKGLIIDVRHNRGGNIDSWILEKLLRKAWFYWQGRNDKPVWNMQYAFRGHMVVLCNEFTASDGEAFSEGFRRLGLGEIIGTRTWGGEIWLSFNNRLVDKGIASAAQWGVYGPEGKWLIEGHGVEPDIVVDNMPHQTFKGSDAQLDAAIKYLQEKIKNEPVDVPPPPPFPDKSFDYNKQEN